MMLLTMTSSGYKLDWKGTSSSDV